jgi:hypothetical protein
MMDHTEAETQVYLTARAYLLANGDRNNAVDRLTEEGLSRVAAGLRADLVPMAFGCGLLKKMGIRNLPSAFNLSDTGEKVKVSNSHVFTTALGFALEVFENGYTEIFSKRVVEMFVSQSRAARGQSKVTLTPVVG